MLDYKKKTISWLAATVIVLIFFHYLGFSRPLERLVVKAFLPLGKVFYSWGTTVNKFSHLGQLVEENQKLQEELGQLSIDYVKLTSLEAENQYLTGELNFLKTARYQFQLANVVGRLPLNDQILIIDRGADFGLKPGLPATVAQGVIVGKILQVEANRSYVELLTSTNSQLAVGLSVFPGGSGLLKGKTGNSLVMDLIPQDQEIKAGDLVISAGLEALVPRGLLVGQVEQITNLAGQIFKQASLAPLVNYQNLKIVTIILGP